MGRLKTNSRDEQNNGGRSFDTCICLIGEDTSKGISNPLCHLEFSFS